MSELAERLARGEIVIMDGGVSTEIERRGLQMDDAAWSGVANKTHPEIVRAMHVAYIQAGAEVITANTFATARHVLEAAGSGAEVAAINRTAVELAREARNEAAQAPVWIAGSISSMPPLTDSDVTPRGEKAAANYREQAEILAGAGVDLIVTEMMLDIENATIVTEAALATGLPVWHGFSAEFGADGESLVGWREVGLDDMPASDFEELVQAITALGGAAAGVMHSFPDATEPALEILRAHWSGPLMAYAETGKFEGRDWNFSQVISPDDYAEAARGWVAQGVQIIGGCCGTNPDHIRRLKETLPPRLPRAA
jgi:homocysteine S-methyltransferase